MSKAGTPIILDNWLHVLTQLDVEQEISGRKVLSEGGYRTQPATFSLLIGAGVVQSSRVGYRLCRPLTEIPFSTVVNLWSAANTSYTRRLFLNYGDLSVDEINRLPVPEREDSVLSLDSVCHVIRSLKYNEHTNARHFCPSWYCRGYSAQVAKDLCRIKLVETHSKKGSALVKRQSEITIGDIMPIVSDKCKTLSKILHLAKDTPLIELFKQERFYE